MPIKTANETYIKRFRELNKLIGNFKVKLENHRKKQKLDKKNWGYSGDLGYLIERMEDLIKDFK